MNHWKQFIDFCRYEKLTGGPDPHMRCIVAMTKDLPFEERLWATFLYMGFYNAPSAEVVWTRWKHDCDRRKMYAWLEENWKGLGVRRERRTSNTPTKIIDFLRGYDMALRFLPADNLTYEELWKNTLGLPRVGRYAATKLTEIWLMMGMVNCEVEDIRPKGGWSPRAALEVLEPGMINHHCKDDSQSAVLEAHNVSTFILAKTCELLGYEISWFEFEVMLCEYKESYKTKRQYPGRSLDSELKYESITSSYQHKHMPKPSRHLKTRALLFPAWALGEKAGWNGVREELGHYVSKYEKTWTDYWYSYPKSLEDLENPVARIGKVSEAMRLTSIHPKFYYRGHTRGTNKSKLVPLLKAKEIGMVVNTALIPDEEMEDKCIEAGIKYLHCPLSDAAEVPKRVAKIIRKVYRFMNANKGGVMTHCDSGKNRSALIGIGALACLTGMSPTYLIRDARRHKYNTLTNPTFTNYLLEKQYETEAS